MEENNRIDLMVDKLVKEIGDAFTVLTKHQRILESLEKVLDELKTENRMRNSVIELRLDRLETRQDTHTHQQYKQGATRKLYNNEQ